MVATSLLKKVIGLSDYFNKDTTRKSTPEILEGYDMGLKVQALSQAVGWSAHKSSNWWRVICLQLLLTLDLHETEWMCFSAPELPSFLPNFRVRPFELTRWSNPGKIMFCGKESCVVVVQQCPPYGGYFQGYEQCEAVRQVRIIMVSR